MKTNVLLKSAAFVVLSLPYVVQAVELSTLADTARGQLGAVADLISSGSYIMGAGLGVMSLLKFKEHNENPQQSKLSKPITLMAVSGGLLALPSFLTVGQDSLGLDVSDEGGLTPGLLR